MDDNLYQQSILTLARSADGAGRIEAPQATATVDNPVCGDRVTIELSMDRDRVAALGHTVRGCVLCMATAAVIGRHAPGLSVEALRTLADRFDAMIRDGATVPGTWPELAAFTPVRSIRSRHECVLLPFAALNEALNKISI